MLSPRANLTHLSCSPNFLPASITRYTQAKHEQILNYIIEISSNSNRLETLLASSAFDSSVLATLLQGLAVLVFFFVLFCFCFFHFYYYYYF